MSMQFNGSVHADGWWDHMPDGHTRNFAMNNGAVDRETNTPHQHQRSHTAAWVLLFAVAAGGVGLVAAHETDPAGFDAKVDAVVASARGLGDKVSNQFDNKKPAVAMDVTALNNNNAPQTTATPSAMPTATTSPAPAADATAAAATPATPTAPPMAVAQAHQQTTPQAGSTPAPQQLLQQQPTGAGTAQAQFKPVPEPAPQVSKSTLTPPTQADPLPMQVQPTTPLQPLTPVQPLQPGTQSPPIPPATQAPPVTLTPPPVTPPTQGPQAMQDQQTATTTTAQTQDNAGPTSR